MLQNKEKISLSEYQKKEKLFFILDKEKFLFILDKEKFLFILDKEKFLVILDKEKIQNKEKPFGSHRLFNGGLTVLFLL